jgi:hypothetical protein
VKMLSLLWRFMLLIAMPAIALGGQTIGVNNVEELYTAVNNPANDNVRILLAPGTYALTEMAPCGTPLCPLRPNLGRLFLREGMDLIGNNSYLLDHGIPQPRDAIGEVFADPATETFIDGSALFGDPPSDAGGSSVIHAGLRNHVQNLTVRGNGFNAAQIEVVPPRSGTSVVVSGCILEGGRRGIFVNNTGPIASGTQSTATIEGNVLRHHRSHFGFGIHVLHFQTVGDQIVVKASNNRVYDNNFGLYLPSLGSIESQTTVISRSNTYQGNAIGIFVIGSRDFGLPYGQPLPPNTPFPSFSGNRTRLDSDGDLVANNVEESSGVGVFAVAGLRDCPPPGGQTPPDPPFICSSPPLGPNGGDISNNEVRLDFNHARFVQGSGDQNGTPGSTDPFNPIRSDLQVLGALSDFVNLPGTANVVLVVIRNSTSDGAAGAFLIAGSDIPDPSQSNKVIVNLMHNDGISNPIPFPF